MHMGRGLQLSDVQVNIISGRFHAERVSNGLWIDALVVVSLFGDAKKHVQHEKERNR